MSAKMPFVEVVRTLAGENRNAGHDIVSVVDRLLRRLITRAATRYHKKVRPVRQRQVDLLHARRRLQGVPGLFTLETAARHAAQLVVHERDQTVERLGVALGLAGALTLSRAMASQLFRSNHSTQFC